MQITMRTKTKCPSMKTPNHQQNLHYSFHLICSTWHVRFFQLVHHNNIFNSHLEDTLSPLDRVTTLSIISLCFGNKASIHILSCQCSFASQKCGHWWLSCLPLQMVHIKLLGHRYQCHLMGFCNE